MSNMTTHEYLIELVKMDALDAANNLASVKLELDGRYANDHTRGRRHLQAVLDGYQRWATQAATVLAELEKTSHE